MSVESDAPYPPPTSAVRRSALCVLFSSRHPSPAIRPASHVLPSVDISVFPSRPTHIPPTHPHSSTFFEPFARDLRERFFGDLDGGKDTNYEKVWALDAISSRHGELGVEPAAKVRYLFFRLACVILTSTKSERSRTAIILRRKKALGIVCAHAHGAPVTVVHHIHFGDVGIASVCNWQAASTLCVHQPPSPKHLKHPRQTGHPRHRVNTHWPNHSTE